MEVIDNNSEIDCKKLNNPTASNNFVTNDEINIVVNNVDHTLSLTIDSDSTNVAH